MFMSCSVRISEICFRCEAVMVCICRRTEMMGCFVSFSMLAYKLYVHQGCVVLRGYILGAGVFNHYHLCRPLYLLGCFLVEGQTKME
jgi:hypothetical protein